VERSLEGPRAVFVAWHCDEVLGIVFTDCKQHLGVLRGIVECEEVGIEVNGDGVGARLVSFENVSGLRLTASPVRRR